MTMPTVAKVGRDGWTREQKIVSMPKCIYMVPSMSCLCLCLSISPQHWSFYYYVLEYNDRATDKQHGYRLNVDHATGLYVTPVVEEKGSGSCFS
jgi:hypothetical protein